MCPWECLVYMIFHPDWPLLFWCSKSCKHVLCNLSSTTTMMMMMMKSVLRQQSMNECTCVVYQSVHFVSYHYDRHSSVYVKCKEAGKDSRQVMIFNKIFLLLFALWGNKILTCKSLELSISLVFHLLLLCFLLFLHFERRLAMFCLRLFLFECLQQHQTYITLTNDCSVSMMMSIWEDISFSFWMSYKDDDRNKRRGILPLLSSSWFWFCILSVVSCLWLRSCRQIIEIKKRERETTLHDVMTYKEEGDTYYSRRSIIWAAKE